MKIKPKQGTKLDAEESEIQGSIDRGEYQSLSPAELNKVKRSIESGAQVAVTARNKEARVNLRLNPDDLVLVKALADQMGLGYQTLMSSVIHRFVHRDLIDRHVVDELKELLDLKDGHGQKKMA